MADSKSVLLREATEAAFLSLYGEPSTVHDHRHLAHCLNDASDDQQRNVYEAEVRFCSEPPPGYERFENVREARQWLHALSGSAEFRGNYPEVAAFLADNPVTVERSTAKIRTGCVYVSDGRIVLSSYDHGSGMVMPVVIHEFAHIVHGRSPADGFQQDHGPEFAAVYLDMVALVYGDDEANRMRRDFEQHNVHVDPGARSVTAAGDGLLAEGRLPRPSLLRTPEAVVLAREQRFVKQAERAARRALKERPEDLRRYVQEHAIEFKRAFEGGADLPPEVLAILNDSNAATFLAGRARIGAVEPSGSVQALGQPTDPIPVPGDVPVLCLSRNTHTGKPCQLMKASCPHPEHKHKDRSRRRHRSRR